LSIFQSKPCGQISDAFIGQTGLLSHGLLPQTEMQKGDKLKEYTVVAHD